VALLKVTIKLFLSQNAQNLVKVIGVLLLISAIHKYVIKVYNDKLAYDWPRNLIHKPYEGVRCISQAKWHDQPLIEAAFSLECRLPFVPFKDPDFLVATSKINLRKDGGSMKFIKQIFQPLNGVPVLDGDLVDGPTINIHSHAPIVLGHE